MSTTNKYIMSIILLVISIVLFVVIGYNHWDTIVAMWTLQFSIWKDPLTWVAACFYFTGLYTYYTTKRKG